MQENLLPVRQNSFQQFTMNRYLLQGIILLIAGVICIFFGYTLMENQNNLYKLLMIAGVLLIGIGVVSIMYRLFRKIDRNSLLDDRNKRQDP